MGLFGFNKKVAMPKPEEALPGRSEAMPVPENHFVNGNPLQPPYPENMEKAMFGMGCFWGAERKFWQQPGVYITAVGYAGRIYPQPDLPRGLHGFNGS